MLIRRATSFNTAAAAVSAADCSLVNTTTSQRHCSRHCCRPRPQARNAGPAGDKTGPNMPQPVFVYGHSACVPRVCEVFHAKKIYGVCDSDVTLTYIICRTIPEINDEATTRQAVFYTFICKHDKKYKLWKINL